MEIQSGQRTGLWQCLFGINTRYLGWHDEYLELFFFLVAAAAAYMVAGNLACRVRAPLCARSS